MPFENEGIITFTTFESTEVIQGFRQALLQAQLDGNGLRC